MLCKTFSIYWKWIKKLFYLNMWLHVTIINIIVLRESSDGISIQIILKRFNPDKTISIIKLIFSILHKLVKNFIFFRPMGPESMGWHCSIFFITSCKEIVLRKKVLTPLFWIGEINSSTVFIYSLKSNSMGIQLYSKVSSKLFKRLAVLHNKIIQSHLILPINS